MTNTMINLTDLYSVEELTNMTLDEIADIIHDICGYYEGIKNDAFTAYLKALSESKKS